MANNFYECAKSGGRIVNRKNKDGEPIKICYDKEGNSHVKRKEKGKIKPRTKNKKQNFSRPSSESLQKLVEHFNN